MSGGRIRSVRFKDGYMADGLSEAFSAIGARGAYGMPYRPLGMGGIFTHQLAIAAYMASGMMRKVITIPAEDRVREWRDWQADADDITKLEQEEKRLGLVQKVQHAEILRGIGGGALVVHLKGIPLEVEAVNVTAGGIEAVTVLSRWEIRPEGFDKNFGSPTFGKPSYFVVDSGNGVRQRIHPSRVICFRGPPVPAGAAISDEEAFWGDSRLLRVYAEVERSDQTQGWFAALVKKAKLLRFGIPDLAELDQSQLIKRVALIAEGENSLNATLYRSSGGPNDPGEVITDYQINWSGIPAVMDAFDQRVAAVADIPFTRLMGRSPAGMNATGQYDDLNWNKTVTTGQKIETRPCLEQLDPFLIRSAGVDPAKVTWAFAPLSVPSETEQTDTFKTLMDAVEKVQATGAIPDEAFAEALQNLLIEREVMPGLEQALEKIPEDERYGISPSDDGGVDDPSALQEGGDPDLAGSGGANPRSPARRAANDAASWLSDATPRPLYVQRKLLNAADLIAWAKENGFASTLPASDMHVTVLYSRSPVDPMKMGRDWSENERGQIVVRPGGPRVVEMLGENAIVLRFASPDLEWRHNLMVEAGGSHDWPEYAPHVTISYTAPEGVVLEALKAFNGELRFGPEIFEALDLDWKSEVVEQ